MRGRVKGRTGEDVRFVVCVCGCASVWEKAVPPAPCRSVARPTLGSSIPRHTLAIATPRATLWTGSYRQNEAPLESTLPRQQRRATGGGGHGGAAAYDRGGVQAVPRKGNHVFGVTPLDGRAGSESVRSFHVDYERRATAVQRQNIKDGDSGRPCERAGNAEETCRAGDRE